MITLASFTATSSVTNTSLTFVWWRPPPNHRSENGRSPCLRRQPCNSPEKTKKATKYRHAFVRLNHPVGHHTCQHAVLRPIRQEQPPSGFSEVTIKHDRWRVIKNHTGFECDLIYLRKNNAAQKGHSGLQIKGWGKARLMCETWRPTVQARGDLLMGGRAPIYISHSNITLPQLA